MEDIMKRRQLELFADSTPIEEALPKQHIPLTLDKLPCITVHYDLFSKLQTLSIEKGIDYFIFRRTKIGRHYKPKNKRYFSIVAVQAGTPKAHHFKSQSNVIATVNLSPNVNPRRNSSQYRLLKQFCDALAAQVR